MKQNTLTPQGRSVRKEYLRQWRQKNKDKVKAYNETYWSRKATKAEAQKGDNNK